MYDLVKDEGGRWAKEQNLFDGFGQGRMIITGSPTKIPNPETIDFTLLF
jgi:hypothetical protein